MCGSRAGTRASLSGPALGGLASVAAACWAHACEGRSCSCASIPAPTAPVPLGVGPNYSERCSKFTGFLLPAPRGCKEPGSSASLTCLCCFLEGWRRGGGLPVPCGGWKAAGPWRGAGGKRSCLLSPLASRGFCNCRSTSLSCSPLSCHAAFAVAEAPPG